MTEELFALEDELEKEDYLTVRELWICDVCGEEFPDTGEGVCPYCGSGDISENEKENV